MNYLYIYFVLMPSMTTYSWVGWKTTEENRCPSPNRQKQCSLSESPRRWSLSSPPRAPTAKMQPLGADNPSKRSRVFESGVPHLFTQYSLKVRLGTMMAQDSRGCNPNSLVKRTLFRTAAAAFCSFEPEQGDGTHCGEWFKSSNNWGISFLSKLKSSRL